MGCVNIMDSCCPLQRIQYSQCRIDYTLPSTTQISGLPNDISLQPFIVSTKLKSHMHNQKVNLYERINMRCGLQFPR